MPTVSFQQQSDTLAALLTQTGQIHRGKSGYLLVFLQIFFFLMITSLVFYTYNQFNTMDTFKVSLYTSVSIIPTCGIHYAETTKA